MRVCKSCQQSADLSACAGCEVKAMRDLLARWLEVVRWVIDPEPFGELTKETKAMIEEKR